MTKRKANAEPGDKDYHRRNLILPEGLSERVLDWHGGQATMVYSLGSTGMSDYVSPSMIDAAVSELEYDLAQNKKRPKDRRWNKKEIAELEELIFELDAVARYPSEWTTRASGLGDVDSGYATWLMDKEENPSTRGLKNKLLR